ncbi:hypothetical protein D5S17_34185 [Pseudonocardiaceae bacterium YIM PH 21723]|nr:hypothetical protein D5S17_34185 [Pseudonocardiaceae bacterium YIM PH 21723]
MYVKLIRSLTATVFALPVLVVSAATSATAAPSSALACADDSLCIHSSDDRTRQFRRCGTHQVGGRFKLAGVENHTDETAIVSGHWGSEARSFFIFPNTTTPYLNNMIVDEVKFDC